MSKKKRPVKYEKKVVLSEKATFEGIIKVAVSKPKASPKKKKP